MYGDALIEKFGIKIPSPGWTTQQLTKDGLAPDLIGLRPDWYLKYVENVIDIMAIKFGYSSENVDMNKFKDLANYAAKKIKEDPEFSLIGIMNYEASKVDGESSFFVPYAHGPG